MNKFMLLFGSFVWNVTVWLIDYPSLFTCVFESVVNPSAEIHSNLVDLQVQLWGEESKSRIDPVEREIGKQTVETLRQWAAPHNTIMAALAMPLLLKGRRHLPRDVFSREEIGLAQRLADRRASLTPGPGGTDPAWLSANLSRMYCEAYLDLPGFTFTLLLLAHHDALISNRPLTKDEGLLTLKVFAPFAEMLGLWSLYREWVDKSYPVIYPGDYADMRQLMGSPDDYTEESFRRILKASSNAGSVANQKILNLLDKATAYVKAKSALEERFAEKGIKAGIALIRNLTGLSLRRVREKESREDVARRLGVRIICESVDDCYAALGILHSLGRPVSFSSMLHFQDHIASPQPNGYQALQAAITYQGYTAHGGGSIVIECRIVTDDMLQMNEYGVVADRRDNLQLTSPANAWWKQVPKLSAQLLRMLSVEHGPTLPEYLRQHNAGSDSNPLYVFTPRGEIVLLPQGSTPLDFAYRIHSEMGHHALRVDVNGQPVPHGYPLHNADIVRVHYDRDYAGPDISWLSLVATQTARINIKRKLAARARVAHQGRAYVEATLLSALDRFQRLKSFKLSVSTDRLDSFLRERASFFGYPDVNALYAKLDGDNQFAQRLVADLVSEELIASVAAPDGEPLPYHLDQMKFCQACMPVPGDPIVGCERIVSSVKKLSIHDASSQRCVTSVEKAAAIQLAWSDETNIDQNELLVFTITGDDRPRLLQDVLDTVYRTEHAYLYKVEATTFGDRQAVISVLVKANAFHRFAEIGTSLGNVAGVREIATAPPSPSQRAMLTAGLLHRQFRREPALPLPNPYTSEEVYTRDIFYDRQELLDEVLKWLREPVPTQPMIIHGQRRVGKTSLVMHLINEYLPTSRLAHAVFVNFQRLSGFTSQDVAGLIVRTVFRDIRQSAPQQEDGEQPMEWLNRALYEALKNYPRLLIIIDEFNVLIDIERTSHLKSFVYNNLRSVMSEQRSVNWLLVVQDTHFFEPEMWQGAGVLFQKSRKYQLKHLDRNWSRRLVVEPARKCGIGLQDEQAGIEEVLRLTAGSPLLIQLLCRDLVERARRQGRSVITDADLETAKNVVIHDGERWFFHFMENLNGVREVVMAVITDLLRNKEFANETDVINQVRKTAPLISEVTATQAIESLAHEGLITLQTDEKKMRQISIQIGLFKEFLSRNLYVHKAVVKWHESLRTATQLKLQEPND